jgi:hypothetical protein
VCSPACDQRDALDLRRHFRQQARRDGAFDFRAFLPIEKLAPRAANWANSSIRHSACNSEAGIFRSACKSTSRSHPPKNAGRRDLAVEQVAAGNPARDHAGGNRIQRRSGVPGERSTASLATRAANGKNDN